MRRARLIELGWRRDLVVEELEDPPAPTRDQIAIAVEACGVCYRDCIDRDGGFAFVQLPITPGHEVVGRVLAIGPDVDEWSVGDRVATMHRDFCGRCKACVDGQTSHCVGAAAVPGLIIDGGYATHMVAPQRCFYRAPDELAAAHAAVLHCTYGTAYRGLRRAGTGAGDHVVVTGANGGVGSAAIQVATRLGASVTAIVRDERHSEALTALGATRVIVDDGTRFHKRLGANAADVALDCVGPPTFNASLRAVRPGGRVVAIGNVSQDKVALNLGYMITRGVQLIGSSGATRADMAELLDLHRAAPFEWVAEDRLELADADRAQRRVRAGGLRGRIVLVPRD